MQKKKSVESSDKDSCDLDALIAVFEREFPTEQACLLELYRRFGIDDGLCRHCHSRNIEKEESIREALCLDCKKTTWFTSGTPLMKLKKAEPRLAKIWLEMRGVSLSSETLRQL